MQILYQHFLLVYRILFASRDLKSSMEEMQITEQHQPEKDFASNTPPTPLQRGVAFS
jgi:hypothetical protein